MSYELYMCIYGDLQKTTKTYLLWGSHSKFWWPPNFTKFAVFLAAPPCKSTISYYKHISCFLTSWSWGLGPSFLYIHEDWEEEWLWVFDNLKVPIWPLIHIKITHYSIELSKYMLVWTFNVTPNLYVKYSSQANSSARGVTNKLQSSSRIIHKK